MRLSVNILLFGDTRCQPSWHVDEVSAGYHRLYHIYRGGCTMMLDGKKEFLKRGLYLFPAARAYTLTHAADDPLTCRWFHVAVLPPIRDAFVRIPERGPMIPVLESLAAVMRDNVVSAVLPLVEALLSIAHADGHIETAADERIARVLAYIDANIHDCPNEALAAAAGLNREYFIRLFEKRMAMTPQEYIARQRILRAQGLIASGAKIASAASAVGFSDDKAFSRFFKARTGMTPAAYRGKAHQP